MVDYKEKTISYRRARWLDEASGLDLEWCIREAHKNLKTLDERTIGYGGQLTKSVKPKSGPHSKGVFLHITTETPGESASVVPHAPPSTSSQRF